MHVHDVVSLKTLFFAFCEFFLLSFKKKIMITFQSGFVRLRVSFCLSVFKLKRLENSCRLLTDCLPGYSRSIDLSLTPVGAEPEPRRSPPEVRCGT